jgi:periplasmic protein TonB
MIALAPEDLTDLRRWAICAAVVVLAHGGIAAAMVTWHEPVEGTGAAAGIVIEFAPVPVAPTTVQSDVPPGPDQDLADAPSKPVESPEEKQKTEEKVEAKLEQKVEEKVESKPVEQPPPEVAPAPDPDVAVPPPPPPQEVKQEMPTPQEARVAAIPTAPHVVAEETASIAAAPRAGPPNPFDSELARKWSSQIHAAILRNKRYPMSARAAGQQGVSRVFFAVDRHGRVTEVHIARSSGVAALDEEALAVVRRAQPFAVPPPELGVGDRVTLDVAINFNIK